MLPDLPYASEWRPCPPLKTLPASLTQNEIHLWAVPMYPKDALTETPCPASVLATLPPNIRLRLQRLRDPALKTQRCILHAWLCEILAAYLGTAPGALPVLRGERGKPEIAAEANPQALTFNLSHSRELALLAIGCSAPLGVDLEYMAPQRNTAALARRYYHPREIRELDALPSEARRRAFYQCWTRKEAYLKAVGSGLSQALTALYVGWEPGGALPPPTATGKAPAGKLRWRLHNLDIVPSYAAALCALNTCRITQTYIYKKQISAFPKS